ncbi:MAG: CpXC domain-containing protein [Candidatus Hodarchaeota archaeon]
MTRLTSTELNCPHCKNNFRVTWAASINTWLNPELIQNFLDDKYYYTCPNCKIQIHLVTKILINCPKGMFWISNDEELETKKSILKEYNVIDEEGKILTPIMGIDLPSENHPSLNSKLGKEIQKLINKFTGKENPQKNDKE